MKTFNLNLAVEFEATENQAGIIREDIVDQISDLAEVGAIHAGVIRDGELTKENRWDKLKE